MNPQDYIAQIYQAVEKDFVTDKFDFNWRDNVKNQFDTGAITPEILIDIAWRQGRRAILIERAIIKLLEQQ